MKVLALMPQEKMMYTQSVQSLFVFEKKLQHQGVDFAIAFTNGMYVAPARNVLAGHAMKLKPEPDYVIWLDSDHIYDADGFLKMVEKMEKNDLPMLSAKYYVRNDLRPNRNIAMGNILPDGKFEKITPEKGETGIKECDVVGFGFLVMKYEFLKEMSEKFNPLFHELDENHVTVGEDLYFCKNVKKLGYKVCYDADTVIGHISIVVSK